MSERSAMEDTVTDRIKSIAWIALVALTAALGACDRPASRTPDHAPTVVPAAAVPLQGGAYTSISWAREAL